MRHVFIALCLVFLATARSFSQSPPDHIVIVIFENRPYDTIVNNAAAPYINTLLNNNHTALLTNSYGLTHPSQPNYIMLFSGSNQGVTNNNIPTGLPFTTPNLGASLLNKGLTFVGYSEDLPYTGFADSIYARYVRKHNPWVNWQGNGINGIPAALNKSFIDFPSNYNNLPTISIIVPNLDNDMHDGSVNMADTWLHNNLDAYVQWCVNNNSLFIVTFDEDNTLFNNHIPTFFTGANIIPGSYNQPVNHYNILRTLEELYQLPYEGISADSSALVGIWQTTIPIIYTFTGNGNWNVASNWSNNTIPPNTLSAGNEIIINPQPGGQCILNVPYTVSAGAKLTVVAGKNFIVQGNLVVQ